MINELERIRVQLADCLARQLSVDAVQVGELTLPEAGHASDMRAFTARWRDARGQHDHRLIARIQPDDQRSLFLQPDIRREGAVVEALARLGRVPVPDVLCIEDDTAIFGRPFYVMDRVDGRVPPDEPCYHTGGFLVDDLDDTQRTRLWENGVATLAQLHDIDWREDFHFLNEPARGAQGLDQYLDWVQRWYRWVQAGREHAIMDEALNFLLAHKPSVTDDGIVWGDARIGNMIFAGDLSVAAVIDWDMAALGPGEVDLGWWLAMDRLASDGLGNERLSGLPSSTATISLYESHRGRKTGDMTYFELLGAFRFATVLLRFADLFRGSPLFDSDTTFGTQSHAVRLVAEILTVPVPELSPDIAKVFKADRNVAQAARAK